MATAPPTDPFFITGDSHADLERMSRALGAADYEPAFRHDPGPMEANACAPAPQGPVAEAHRRVRAQLGALRTVLGRSVLVLLEEAVDDLHYAGADYRERTIMLEGVTRRLGNQVDAARSLAARLEEEVARLGTDPWLGRYLQALEDAVGEERLGEVQQAASEAWRAAGSPAPAPVEPVAVAVPDPGLPVVDDASLPERALQFRGSRGELLAVGALERVFGALDQATEIAVGALTDVDGPDAAHPLDEIDGDSPTD